MLKPNRNIGHISVYGDWDDTYSHQFMIYDNTEMLNNEFVVHVFILGGCDYGGGIKKDFSMSLKKLDDILSSCNYASEAYEKLCNY